MLMLLCGSLRSLAASVVTARARGHRHHAAITTTSFARVLLEQEPRSLRPPTVSAALADAAPTVLGKGKKASLLCLPNSC